jgi:hypothetical protein
MDFPFKPMEFTNGQYRVALGASPKFDGMQVVVASEATQSVLHFETVPWVEFIHLMPSEPEVANFFYGRIDSIISNLSETKH